MFCIAFSNCVIFSFSCFRSCAYCSYSFIIGFSAISLCISDSLFLEFAYLWINFPKFSFVIFWIVSCAFGCLSGLSCCIASFIPGTCFIMLNE